MSERILLLSDTHGGIEQVLDVCRQLSDVDRIIHLGDHSWDAQEMQERLGRVVLAVRGNNDWGSSAPKQVELEIEGFRLFLTHGHKQGVLYGLDTIARVGAEHQADFAIFGHSHVFVDEMLGGVHLLNPGSPTLPRDGAAGMALLTLEAGEEPVVEHILL